MRVESPAKPDLDETAQTIVVGPGGPPPSLMREAEPSNPRALDPFAALAGGLSAALGGIVLLGWHFGVTPLLQVHPGLTPMAYNTAVCFVLLGSAFLAVASGTRSLARVASAAAGLIALGRLFQYVSGVPRDFETFLSRFTLPHPPVAPVPMAPNTAIGFILIAAAAWLCSAGPRLRWRVAGVAFCGSAAAALGLNALIGYVTGLPTYLWGHFKSMAFHTAAGLIVLGLAAVGFSWRDARKNLRSWTAVIVAMTGAITSISLWQALSLVEDLHLEKTIRYRSALPEAVLIFSLLVTALLGIAVYLAQTARVRTSAAERLRGETEEALRALGNSERTYRKLLETLPQKIVYKDRNGLYVSCNENFARDLNLSATDIAGKTDSDFFPKELAEKYRADDRRVMESGETVEIEEEYLSQGRKQSVQTAKTPVRDEWGAVTGVLAIFWDITERKRAEQAVQQALQYNRSLIEASLDPLVTIAPDGMITDVNRATEQVTGCPRQKLIGTDFCDYFTDRQKARDGYQQVFREGLVQDYELAVRRRDGQITPVLYNASVYRDEGGAVVGVFAAARDITERKRAEEELAGANAYNRSLIEASLDPLVTIAPDGKITDVNHATELVTGCARQELIGTDFCDYFTEPRKARDGYQQVFREGLVQNYELALRRRDGRITPVLYNASVYRDEAGAITGVFAAARDITERKRAEQALEQKAQDLARSNADLEQFAYVASHDLQEPLRMVANFTQLLAERYRDRLTDEGVEFIGYAVDGARRMQRLIQDLLTYSRLGTRGKSFESADCNELLGAAVANLQVAIQENGALISHDELPTVKGDASQLAQLFQNLAGNAIKFHAQDPPRVHVSAARRGSQWVFSVRDNGIGIDPEFADRIFVIFQRLHSRGDYPGTGIGLALCKKIVERHGGTIWVESKPGQGATFFFTIPAA